MTNPTEYYHLTVDGVPMCANRATSYELSTPVACEHYPAATAEAARSLLAEQLPETTVVIVVGKCPRPNVVWEE
ncbi:hypothetical protein ABTO99_18420, partial [Acinetobacter baumannii]